MVVWNLLEKPIKYLLIWKQGCQVAYTIPQQKPNQNLEIIHQNILESENSTITFQFHIYLGLDPSRMRQFREFSYKSKQYIQCIMFDVNNKLILQKLNFV